MTDHFEIAVGYDQTSGTEPLYDLGDANEFARYVIGDPKMQWHAEEKIVVDGNLNSRRRGLPWLEVKLTVVTEPEALLIEELVGPVTIYWRDRLSENWGYWNGELQFPDWGAFDQKYHHFIDGTVTIKALRLIEP